MRLGAAEARAIGTAFVAFALACQGAPRAGDPSDSEQPSASKAADVRPPQQSVQAPSRAPCWSLAPEQLGVFERILPGDRFAVFRSPSGGHALDLDLQVITKVDGAIEPVSCGDHCVAYAPAPADLLDLRPRASELRLRNLATGEEASFAGKRVELAQLPPHQVALRDGTSLGLLDASSRSWLARVTTKWPATSVALSADGRSLYALSLDPARDHDDEHNYDAWLEVLRVPYDGSPIRGHRHRYTAAKLAEVTKFDGALVKTGEPRVYRLDSGPMVVGHITGCETCAGRFPEAHLYRVVDPETGQLTGEAGFRYLTDLAAGGLEHQLWPSEQASASALQERVQRALAAAQCAR